ncbi:hypothetical protein [Streptomyces sp. NPDC051162]|uniref:hypothetical protein n=1 Tax=Streptomyces sp. NPDC051162 TaxID=3154747 RepID=UPI0034242F20
MPIDTTDPQIRTALLTVRRHLTAAAAVLDSPDPGAMEETLTRSAREAHRAMQDAGLLGLPDDEVLAAVDRLDA